MGKKFLVIFGIFAVLGVALWAGTTDNLGLSDSWTTISGWFTDGYMMKIIAIFMTIFAIIMMIQQKFIYGGVLLAMVVVLSNVGDIVKKIASATF